MPPKTPILDSCCRCATLKTGTIITGALGIVLGLISLIIIICVPNLKVRTIVIESLPIEFVKIVLAINLCMTILISTLLIIGAVKRNRFLLLPWVALGLMLAVGLLISVLYTSIEHYIHKEPISGTLWLIFGIIAVVVYVYMWLVVLSFYQVLREERGRGPYGKPPYPQPGYA